MLAKKEISDIHKDWLQELEEHRKPEQIKLTGEEKASVIEFTKLARTNYGSGVVSFRTISKLVEKKLGHKVGRTTLNEWVK